MRLRIAAMAIPEAVADASHHVEPSPVMLARNRIAVKFFGGSPTKTRSHAAKKLCPT